MPGVLLHGGPGAPGYLAPVARELSDAFRVLEPLQRGSSREPLTVARHVADLHEVVSGCAGGRPALVGHSWGAMLGLAYAAAHPGRVSSLVLVGCGTFDTASRERLRERREERMDGELRRRLEDLAAEFPNPNERMRERARLLLSLDAHYPLPGGLEEVTCDARAHDETWADMLRLQEEGVYPAAFAAIDAPALMLHGAVDVHPGRLIRASLEPRMPRLEYVEWERCGHYPWLERQARDAFFAVLRRWLAANA